MKTRNLVPCIAVVSGIALFTGKVHAGNYYVDCDAATNGGGTQTSPWNSVESINNFGEFSPGSQILLKRGTRCEGAIKLSGSGASGSSNVLGAYGAGHLPIPLIEGKGVPATVDLFNEDNWRIENLEITNGAAEFADRKGVWVHGFGAGTLNNIRIQNLKIHNIKGCDNVGCGKLSGGIIVETHKGDRAIKFNSLESGSQYATLNVAKGTNNYTVNVGKDAFVRDGSKANTNYGSSSDLIVKRDASGYNRLSFVEFDLGSISAPNNNEAFSAELELTGANVQDNSNLFLMVSKSSTFNEDTITWNNKPACEASENWFIVRGNQSQRYSIDLSNVVKGSLSSGENTLALCISAGVEPTKYNNVKITNNEIYDAVWGGIQTLGDSFTDSSVYFTNVSIDNNYLHDLVHDGIILRSTKDGIIERNLSADVATDQHGHAVAAIWTRSTVGAVTQFNEVYGSTNPTDGQAFDSDLSDRDATVQYNYSHDNNGLMLIMPGTPGVTLRYNISQNDGFGSGVIHAQGSNAKIYNNTIYSPYPMFEAANGSGEIKNNIFYMTGSSDFFRGSRTQADGNFVFSNNVYFGNRPADEPVDTLKKTADPLLVSPGSAGQGMDTVDGYKLRSDSPYISAGLRIDDNGDNDFDSTPLPFVGNPSIGAFEHAGSGSTHSLNQVNAGSDSSYVSIEDTRTFIADKYFSGGNVGSKPNAIANTINDDLYRTYRYGMSSYKFPVKASGTYKVIIYMIEPYFNSAGQRVFDVTAENQLKITDLDIYAEAGKFNAYKRSFTVDVYDGELTLDFSNTKNYAVVSAIDVQKL